MEIFLKLTSLRTIVTLSALGSSRDIVSRLVVDGYAARRIGTDIVVVEEKS